MSRPFARIPHRHFVLAVLALFVCVSGPAVSADWSENEQSRVRLISAQSTLGENPEVTLGIEIELKDGWKTYWRSPGDAGYAPSVVWNGSENMSAAPMLWPVPHRFSLFDLDTFGYGSRVVFPVPVAVTDLSQPIHAVAKVDYLVCREACIPHSELVELTLSRGPGGPSEHAQILDLFQSQVPDDGSQSGLTIDAAYSADNGSTLVVEASSLFAFDDPDVLVEGAEDQLFFRPEIEMGDDGVSFIARVPVETLEGQPGDISGTPVTVTVTDGARGAERKIAAVSGSLLQPDQANARSFLALIGIAFVGGLILNLMPCVLPVLSIKLLSVVSHGGGSRSKVRRSFFASAMGILVSFWAIAALVLVLRAAGVAVGWGIQFQNVYFLLFITLAVAIFAYNMFGLFEIPLPWWLAQTAQIGDAQSLRGNFLTGVFATLLATPCSAPFVGTAVGFALSSGPNEILTIFTFLGLGLAAPFLLVTLFPELATCLPKPGKWMLTLRKILGLALAATAIWLLSVIAGVNSLSVALVAGVGLAFIGVVMMAAGRFNMAPRTTSILSLVGLAVLLVSPQAQTLDAAASADRFAVWASFEPELGPTLVKDGRVVFIDVTADWCITCKVNKRIALGDDEVIQALSDPSVIAMQGDWTRRDDGILTFLTDHGRYGIPFNVVYGPGAPDGLVLPELLSKSAVLDAIAKAGG